MSKNLSLLIVDSNRRTLDTMTKWFLQRGHQVTAVMHPRQALEAATFRDYDAAVIEQALPEKSGLQLMRKLRGLVGDLRVILLSSDPNSLTRQEALQCGAHELLYKTCQLREIDSCLTDTAPAVEEFEVT
ncbi:response regulator [Adhaeretor mobilis]|uniref:Osmolarity response regulator n=1 Tax=Adhaeretor mobilis TaxID=1930276 RepID=A0A517MZH3_9BACT|nr:response regulator [Adhaeretor mobilis]QDT00254.1 osmolarity response regulator [Adhaeretor mobilis]